MAITPYPVQPSTPSTPGGGGLTMVKGTSSFTGNNTKDTVIVPHGLSTAPQFATAVSQSPIPFAINLHVTWDATNVTVKFQEPPRYGDVVITWAAWA